MFRRCCQKTGNLRAGSHREAAPRVQVARAAPRRRAVGEAATRSASPRGGGGRRATFPRARLASEKNAPRSGTCNAICLRAAVDRGGASVSFSGGKEVRFREVLRFSLPPARVRRRRIERQRPGTSGRGVVLSRSPRMGGELHNCAPITRRARAAASVFRSQGRAAREIAGSTNTRIDWAECCSGRRLRSVAAPEPRISGGRGMRFASVTRCAAGLRAALG